MTHSLIGPFAKIPNSQNPNSLRPYKAESYIVDAAAGVIVVAARRTTVLCAEVPGELLLDNAEAKIAYVEGGIVKVTINGTNGFPGVVPAAAAKDSVSAA